MTLSSEHPDSPTLKQKVRHELREMAVIFLYLATFFCALATHSTLLLHEFHVSYFAYGTALLNALIMSKVIMLGEYAGLGSKQESKPLIITAILKAFQFAVLMVVFHVVEEVVKHLLHGHSAASAVRELMSGRLTEILARNLVIFFALIPFFAFREFRRVLGDERYQELVFRRGAAGPAGGN